MKVSLYKRKNAKGIKSLYLDYYEKGKRVRERLNLYLYPGKKFDNEQTTRLAEAVRAQREHEIKSGLLGFIPEHRKKQPIFKWMDKWTEAYNKKNKRMFRAVYGAFSKWADNEYLPATAITTTILNGFWGYLHRTYNGHTPFDYWKVLKRILKAATEEGFFKVNPADSIKIINHREGELTKQVLMDDEINLLAKAYCGNDEIKRAFLFSTQTGLRKCDIIRLQWKHVHIENRYIDFGQAKTGRRNVVPLNDSALILIGESKERDEYVFDIQQISTNGVNKVIKYWVKKAGINKHITYHCARHSFGTNLLIHEVDLKTASKALGHTSTRHTEKYTHISDAMKHRAVNKLPDISF